MSKTLFYIERIHDGDDYLNWQGEVYPCQETVPYSAHPYIYLRLSIDAAHAGWISYQKLESSTLVFDVFVKERYRGQGVASALIRRAVRGREHLILSGCWQEDKLATLAERHNMNLKTRELASRYSAPGR